MSDISIPPISGNEIKINHLVNQPTILRKFHENLKFKNEKHCIGRHLIDFCYVNVTTEREREKSWKIVSISIFNKKAFNSLIPCSFIYYRNFLIHI